MLTNNEFIALFIIFTIHMALIINYFNMWQREEDITKLDKTECASSDVSIHVQVFTLPSQRMTSLLNFFEGYNFFEFIIQKSEKFYLENKILGLEFFFPNLEIFFPNLENKFPNLEFRSFPNLETGNFLILEKESKFSKSSKEISKSFFSVYL